MSTRHTEYWPKTSPDIRARCQAVIDEAHAVHHMTPHHPLKLWLARWLPVIVTLALAAGCGVLLAWRG